MRVFRVSSRKLSPRIRPRREERKGDHEGGEMSCAARAPINQGSPTSPHLAELFLRQAGQGGDRDSVLLLALPLPLPPLYVGELRRMRQPFMQLRLSPRILSFSLRAPNLCQTQAVGRPVATVGAVVEHGDERD